MAAMSKQTVLLADPRPESRAELERIIEQGGLAVKSAETGKEAIDAFYAEAPQCIVLSHGLEVRDGVALIDEIKGDNVYGHLPVIALVSVQDIEKGIDWEKVLADDYVIEPFSPRELVSRIRFCWARAQRDVNANPLTGLPGNLTVNREAERRLAAGDEFAFAYLDLDSFKAFNDKYGFARGDEVLRMTARVLVNVIRSFDNSETYVGHIGGDDFVFMMPSELMPPACEKITQTFDLVVRDFYDKEDRDQGSIRSVDRQGNPETYPIMSCSIGVVDTGLAKLTHIAELFGRVNEVKSYAKRLPGSRFIIDRRQ